MTKQTKTTMEKYLESMGPKERKAFDDELRALALSEMFLAAMEGDEVAVRKLAKLAGVSPTIVQRIQSGKKDDFALKSLFEVLDSLGFKLFLERDGDTTPLDISWFAH